MVKTRLQTAGEPGARGETGEGAGTGGVAEAARKRSPGRPALTAQQKLERARTRSLAASAGTGKGKRSTRLAHKAGLGGVGPVLDCLSGMERFIQQQRDAIFRQAIGA